MTTPARRSFTGTEARQLLRRARTAALGTSNLDPRGPYISLANIATDGAGYPLRFAAYVVDEGRLVNAREAFVNGYREIPCRAE